MQVVASPVVGIARTDTGLEVRAAEAPPARAREVVLAVGAPSASTPLPIDPGLRGDPAVVFDPWAPGALGGGPRRWLVAGTGLTMVDVALTALRPARHHGRGVLRGTANCRERTPAAAFGPPCRSLCRLAG